MSLRFSLLGLIGLVTLSALACAALVKPGPGWLSVVVSLTAAAVGAQALRAMFARGESRAAAVGWLVFAVGYLAVSLGPWLGQHVGPQLASSKALALAQVRWRKEDPTATQSQYEQQMIQQLWGLDYMGSTGRWNLSGIPVAAPLVPNVRPVNCFQLSGHWLFAWLAGWLGAVLAGHFQRRRGADAGA